MAQVCQKQLTDEKSLNKAASKDFVRKMLAIGISNIVYLRNIFPECAFSDRKIEDLPLKILKEHGHEGSFRIVQWMKGVYDALDHEYLRALIFAIISDPENMDSVIESYTFGFTYFDGCVKTSLSVGDEEKSFIPTQSQTKDSARQFLRNLIILTSTMEALPPGIFMTVRLLYYDKVTPSAYQPPGFIEAREKDTLHFAFENIRIKLGDIVTPYTFVKIRMRAGKDQFAPGQNELTDQQLVMNDSQCTSLSQADQSMQLGTGDKECHGQKKQSNRDEEMELGVRCPCLDLENDGVMIMCSKCNYWQHAICFCLCDTENMPEVHICHLCADDVTDICTDPQLGGMQKDQQKETCSWRRTLLDCFEHDTTSVVMISENLSCTKIFAQKILGRLMDEGIAVVKKRQKQIKIINQERLKEVFNRDVKHVSDNLLRQRNDPPDVEMSDSSGTKKNETATTAAPAKERKRRASSDCIKSSSEIYTTAEEGFQSCKVPPSISPPFHSQASLDAFRTDMKQKAGAPSRKKRKMSTSARKVGGGF